MVGVLEMELHLAAVFFLFFGGCLWFWSLAEGGLSELVSEISSRPLGMGYSHQWEAFPWKKEKALSLSYSQICSPLEQCMKGRVCWDSSQRRVDSVKPICGTRYYNNIRGKNKGWWIFRCDESETVTFQHFKQTGMFCLSKEMKCFWFSSPCSSPHT